MFQRFKPHYYVLISVLLMVMGWLLIKNTTIDHGVTLQGKVGTAVWHVRLHHLPPNHTVQTLESTLNQRLSALNQRIGTWDESSQISRFNAYTGSDWFPVDPAVAQLVATALSISAESHGKYDVTISPLIALWGFGKDITASDAIPTQAAIQAAQQRVGYAQLNVRQSPPALQKKRSGVSIELASLADGAAADTVAHYLDSIGVENYFIDMAGEARSRGVSPRGDGWHVAIEKPVDTQHSIQQGLRLQNVGLATSGDYRNYFMRDGKRYSHILDPTTGAPVEHHLASVTVIADDATTADAYATLLMVLGEGAGKTFAETRHLVAYFIVRTPTGFETFSTQHFEQYFDTAAEKKP